MDHKDFFMSDILTFGIEFEPNLFVSGITDPDFFDRRPIQTRELEKEMNIAISTEKISRYGDLYTDSRAYRDDFFDVKKKNDNDLEGQNHCKYKLEFRLFFNDIENISNNRIWDEFKDMCNNIVETGQLYSEIDQTSFPITTFSSGYTNITPGDMGKDLYKDCLCKKLGIYKQDNKYWGYTKNTRSFKGKPQFTLGADFSIIIKIFEYIFEYVSENKYFIHEDIRAKPQFLTFIRIADSYRFAIENCDKNLSGLFICILMTNYYILCSTKKASYQKAKFLIKPRTNIYQIYKSLPSEQRIMFRKYLSNMKYPNFDHIGNHYSYILLSEKSETKSKSETETKYMLYPPNKEIYEREIDYFKKSFGSPRSGGTIVIEDSVNLNTVIRSSTKCLYDLEDSHDDTNLVTLKISNNSYMSVEEKLPAFRTERSIDTLEVKTNPMEIFEWAYEENNIFYIEFRNVFKLVSLFNKEYENLSVISYKKLEDLTYSFYSLLRLMIKK